MEQTYLGLLDILQNYYNQIILQIAFPNMNNNSYRPTSNSTCLSRQQYAVWLTRYCKIQYLTLNIGIFIDKIICQGFVPIRKRVRAKSKTSVFATDGIWLTFSFVLNFQLLGWTPWVGFQNERLMCFYNRQKWNGHSWACCYSNTICKCDGRNQLFHFFPSVACLRLCCHSNAFDCGSIFSFSYWSMLIAL